MCMYMCIYIYVCIYIIRIIVHIYRYIHTCMYIRFYMSVCAAELEICSQVVRHRWRRRSRIRQSRPLSSNRRPFREELINERKKGPAQSAKYYFLRNEADAFRQENASLMSWEQMIQGRLLHSLLNYKPALFSLSCAPPPVSWFPAIPRRKAIPLSPPPGVALAAETPLAAQIERPPRPGLVAASLRVRTGGPVRLA